MRAAPRGLLLVWFEVPSEVEEEFNEWYDKEHVPQREAIPGFLSARRFVAVQGGPRYLAIYDLRHADVLSSAPYLQIIGVNESPWTARIRRKATYLRRNVYEQILPAPNVSVWVTGPHSPAGDPTGSALLIEAADIQPEMDDEFNLWYNQQHVQNVLAAPGFRAARRFRALEGQPQYLALYELDSVDALPTGASAPGPGQMAKAACVQSPQLSLRYMLYEQIYP